MSHNKNHEIENLVKRINRIEGQVGGIRRMIQDEKPFEEVIIQLNSTKSAIQKISQLLLEVGDSALESEELASLQKAIHQYSKLL